MDSFLISASTLTFSRMVGSPVALSPRWFAPESVGVAQVCVQVEPESCVIARPVALSVALKLPLADWSHWPRPMLWP